MDKHWVKRFQTILKGFSDTAWESEGTYVALNFIKLCDRPEYQCTCTACTWEWIRFTLKR